MKKRSHHLRQQTKKMRPRQNASLSQNTNKEVEVETTQKLSSDGSAIARLDTQKIVFVEGALPDEHVLINISSEKKDFARASALEIYRANQHRVEPQCPAFLNKCGGCQLWHLDIGQHLAYKKSILFDALERLGKWPQNIRDDLSQKINCISLSTQNYRHRIRLHVDNNCVGFYTKGSHEIVETSSCMVANKDIPFAEISKSLKSIGTSFECEITISNTKKITITNSDREIQKQIDILFSKAEWYSKSKTIDVDHPFSMQFKIHSAGFLQPHQDAQKTYANICYDVLKNYFLTSKNSSFCVADLYAGAGAFSGIASIAAHPKHTVTTAVEGVTLASELIGSNWPDASIDVINQDVDSYLSDKSDVFDVVLTDPPRTGMSAATANQLVKACKQNGLIFYIACDAASLARDGRVFLDNGFLPTSAHLVDAFGYTMHFETLMVFNR